MIDQASVFAERFRNTPGVLQASVMGQGTDPSLDPYTALRALQLIKESNAMMMSRQAQGPTSAPSLAAQAIAPQGLAAMTPMGAPAGQIPQQGPQQMPQRGPQLGPQQMPQRGPQQASGGVAGMPTPDADYADGGIVAFAGGGTPRTTYTQAAFDATPQPTTMADRKAGITEQQGYAQELYGPDRMAPYAEEIAKERRDLDGQSDKQLGYALLAAAQAVAAKPSRSIMPALANAAGAFGAEMQKSDKETREAKRMLRQSEITLAAAQQARADGKTDKAISLWDKAKAEETNAKKTLSALNMDAAKMEQGIEAAEITARATMAGVNKSSDFKDQKRDIYNAMVAQDPSIPRDPAKNAKALAAAGAQAYEQAGRYPAEQRAAAGEAKLEATVRQKASESADNALLLNSQYRQLQKEDAAAGVSPTSGKANAMREQFIERELRGRSVSAAAPAAQPTVPPVRGAVAAVTRPDIDTFLAAAKKANPGATDAELRAFYKSEYK